MNTGDPSFAAGPDELDMDGEPRIVAGRVDMGADEFLYPGDFDLDGDVDGLDLGTFIAHWLADDCNEPNGYCDGTDLNKSGKVDGKDYGLFAGHWASELTALVVDEDFETGDFSKYDWQHSGAVSWGVVSDIKYEGSYSAKSGAISDGEQTVLEISVNTGIGSVSFYCKVSSEADEDYLRFYIGVRRAELVASGICDHFRTSYIEMAIYEGRLSLGRLRLRLDRQDNRNRRDALRLYGDIF
jgi:hypothetical protein